MKFVSKVEVFSNFLKLISISLNPFKRDCNPAVPEAKNNTKQLNYVKKMT